MSLHKNENRILIKLSGGALSKGSEKYNEEVLKETAKKVKNLKEKYQVALVVGGGNLFRGRDLSGNLSILRPTADYIGMLATVQNALVMRDFFISQGIDVRVSSAISMPQICESYIPQKVLRHMEKGRVVIFAGGTGMPYFTTDTVAAQRALELGCSILVMAKDGTDGVYTKDPNKYDNAEKIKTITATEVIEKNLQVADLSSIAMCRDNKLKIKVVSMENLDKINDDNYGTIILPS